jgi:prevent-host-death family protein
MATTSVNAATAKEELAELINRVMHHKERIILTRRDKEVAALISMEDFALLQDIQNKMDLTEATEALKETRNQGSTSLDDLKEEIG